MVTDIRQSSTRDTFIAERVYLVLNSLLDWKPVEKLKQRWCDVVSFMGFFQYETSSTVLYVTKALDRGSRQARKERIAVVKAWENEWGDQFHCSVGGKILLDRTNSTELVAAGFDGLTDEVCQWQCAVKENTEVFVSQREGLWYHQAERCWQK